MDNSNIFILSRPLSNILDEGSKNLVYYLCKNSDQKYIVPVEKNFTLELPESITISPIPFDIDKKYVESSKSIWIKLFLIWQLLKISKYGTIHVFFTVTNLNSIILLIFNLLFKKKIILNLPTIKENSMNSFFIKFLFIRSSKVVVMSTFSKNKLKEFKNKTIIIPPLIDDKKYFPPKKIRIKELKVKLNIESPFVVIIPGEYGRLNMNENIVDIISTVNSQIKDCLFILSFRLKNETDKGLENEIKNYLKGCNVLFLNTVNNYDEYCAISNLAIFPAKSMEGKFDLPLSLVELMAMGIPVLHTNIEPLNELYENKEHVCLSCDANSFSLKIKSIIEDKKLNESLIDKTLKESMRFLPGTIINKYAEVYD